MGSTACRQGAGPGGFKLAGGDPCLDFANTVDWHASRDPHDRLSSYDDLVAWSRQAGLLSQTAAGRLRREAARRPAAAARTYRGAIALREAIYSIFAALARDRTPASADLAVLNAWLARALGRQKVVRAASGLAMRWDGGERTLDAMLWPLVRSAAELATSARRSRVGQCEDERGCGWLFLDRSRNRSRRWCDMSDCGNRAKVRKYHLRSRASRAEVMVNE